MNTVSTIRDGFSAHSFAHGLAPSHVDTLAGMATMVEFSADSWIARQGQHADRFFLLLDGRAAVEAVTPGRVPLVISTVHADQIFGWSWLFPPHRWHFDVVALEHVRVLSIDAGSLRAACDADHDLGYEVTKRLANVIGSRLEATRLQLVDVYGHPH